MGKFNVASIVNSAKCTIAKRSPEILTGIGITGMITTTVLAVKATPKALDIIEEEKRRQDKQNIDEANRNGWAVAQQVTKLRPIEVIKVTWKCYIPSAVTCVTSIMCLIGASSVNARRNAALATAYKLSTAALSEYKDKVIEVIGENKAKEIHEKIVEDKIRDNPASSGQIIITDAGDTLCYDCLAGRYFKSSIDKIKKAENEINRRMLRDMYVSLNDFYDELGLSHTDIGSDLGWNMDYGFIELTFSSHLTDDNKPCLAIDYSVDPRYGFDSFC